MSLKSYSQSFYTAFLNRYYSVAIVALIVEAIVTLIGVVAGLIFGAPSAIIFNIVLMLVVSALLVFSIAGFGDVFLSVLSEKLQKLAYKSPNIFSRLQSYAGVFSALLVVLGGVVAIGYITRAPFFLFLSGKILLSTLAPPMIVLIAIQLGIHAILASAMIFVIPAVLVNAIWIIARIIHDIGYAIFGGTPTELISAKRFSFGEGKEKIQWKNESSETQISALPKDMMIYLLQTCATEFDDPKDFLAVANTCKFWNNETKSNTMWYSLYKNTEWFKGKEYNPKKNYMAAAFKTRIVYIAARTQQPKPIEDFSLSPDMLDPRQYFNQHQGVVSDSVVCMEDLRVAKQYVYAHGNNISKMFLYEVEILESVFAKRKDEDLKFDEGVTKDKRFMFDTFVSDKAKHIQKTIPWAAIRRTVSVMVGTDKYVVPEDLSPEDISIDNTILISN